MNWKRARTEEKKDERKEAVYSAALPCLRRRGYEGVSFNGIAAEAKFTKLVYVSILFLQRGNLFECIRRAFQEMAA